MMPGITAGTGIGLSLPGSGGPKAKTGGVVVGVLVCAGGAWDLTRAIRKHRATTTAIFIFFVCVCVFFYY